MNKLLHYSGWGQVLNALIGVWLMGAPAALGYGAPASTNDRLFGPLAATFAVVALWEATRPVRWVNLPIGVWLVISPMILGYSEAAPIVNSIVCGAVLVAMSFTGARVEKRFGAGWRSLWPLRKMRAREAESYGPGADWYR